MARLLHALRRAAGAEAHRSLDRRGSLAEDGRAARRQRGRRRARSRRLPEVGVHAGFEITHHELRRQDLARRRADGRGRRDSVHGESRSAARPAREVRLPHRRREADGVADPRRPPVARWHAESSSRRSIGCGSPICPRAAGRRRRSPPTAAGSDAAGTKPGTDAAEKPMRTRRRSQPPKRREARGRSPAGADSDDSQRPAPDDRHRRRARAGLVARRPVHRLRHLE